MQSLAADAGGSYSVADSPDNLAQIYDDLGFGQLAVNQGFDSLTIDPGSTSTHRFLADAYVATPRREIARVSELLQAQMLQDININPIQPSLAETNLSLATRGGPFKPGYNEYTPLFERNDVEFQTTGLVGNEDSAAGEAIASALYGRFSVSGGAFRYETDGWRPNAGIQHDIYDLFVQSAVTPDLNLQFELRRHPDLRRHHNARNRRQILHRIHLLPSPHSQHSPADQKQRQIRPNLRRNPQPLRRRHILLQCPFQTQQR